MLNSGLLVNKYCSQISLRDNSWKLTLIIALDKWVHIIFYGTTFWCPTPCLKYQPTLELWNWSLDVINLLREQCAIYIPEYIFLKTSRDPVDETVDEL